MFGFLRGYKDETTSAIHMDSFKRALFGQPGTSQGTQSQVSKRKFRSTFLNGKQIDVEYIYDRRKRGNERLKINIHLLLPIFGGVKLPNRRKFLTLLDVEAALKIRRGLHLCEDGIYSPCSNLDGQLRVEEDTCPFEHFHHYCPEHVNAWFKWYLLKAIALREVDYEMLVESEDSQNPDHKMTERRFDPECWLRFAQQHGCGCSRKISPKQLGQLSTNIFPATFLDGKQIDVEYNYDRTRPRKERVQINLEGLLPVIGGTMPPDGKKFLSTYAMEDFLKANLDLHECCNGLFTACTNLDSDLEEEDSCPYDHFHHYCPEHVSAWFKYYLTTVITIREGDHAELLKRGDPKYNDYLTTGDRLSPKYWLRFAERRECSLCREHSQELPRQLLKNKIRATFLNGKEIVVTYKYDRQVVLTEEPCIKVNIEDLLPVLGRTMPRDMKAFVSPLEIVDELSTMPALHECEDGIFTPCSNLDACLQMEEDRCTSNHFHHYCPKHVSDWLTDYLPKAITIQEGDFPELLELTMEQGDSPMTGDHLTPEYWLRDVQLRGCGLFRGQKISPKQEGPPSTNIFPATFFNGKQIDVEYNYDRTRPCEQRVQINIQGLLPVFGGNMPPDGRLFVSVFDVEDILKSSPGLHECGDGIYTPCSNLDAELQVEENTCPFQHFHHYCPIHVNAWFKWYLLKAIGLREHDYCDLVILEGFKYHNGKLTGFFFDPKSWLRFAQEHGCGCSRKISPK